MHPETPNRSDIGEFTVAGATVQALVESEGNREAIRSMLADTFTVETGPSVGEADLYLIEDRLLDEYREALRERMAAQDPTFCPVVVIQRDRGFDGGRFDEMVPTAGDGTGEHHLTVDEVVQAPVDPRRLLARIRSLLVRRQQSLELQTQVSTLEAKERELTRYKQAVEETGNGIALTDERGTIEFVNVAFEEITGHLEDDAVGSALSRIQHPDSETVFDESFWRTMETRGEWAGELVVERADGRRCISDTTVTPIEDESGAVDGYVVALTNITDHIQREQLLEDREQELDLLRQILLRYLRHNLRNDLNVIQGYAELLADRISPAYRDDLGRIIETTNRLIETNETARTYSELIEQESELYHYDLGMVVQSVLESVELEYPDTAFETDLEKDCTVLAREGIQKALEGLLDNAAKHNDAADPWVRVTVESAPDRSVPPSEDTGCRVVIEDNGPGISDLEVDTLELGSETALIHSQGIGLWLSKWLIEGVDGSLDIETTAAGTRVVVTYPEPSTVGDRGVEVSDLTARERRLETITQRMTDAVIEVDAAWNITFIDERAQEILAVDSPAILGADFWGVFPDARDTGFEGLSREAMASRESSRLEEYHPGIDAWLDVHLYPDFDGGLSIYFSDVTERKQHEHELEQARDRMELALQATEAAVWELDAETQAVTTHPEVHSILERTIDTVSEFTAMVHPDDRDDVESALEAALEAESNYDIEYRVQVGGECRWVRDKGEVRYRDDGGRLLVGVAQEVTARKERERRLAEKERLVQSIFDSLPDILYAFETDGTLIRWNEQLERVTGYSAEEIENRNISSFVPSEERETIATELGNVLSDREPLTVESRLLTKTGETIPYEFTGGVLEASDGSIRGVTGIGRDISEQKQQKRELEGLLDRLEEQERELRLALEAGGMGMWVYDVRSMEALTHTSQHDRIFGYEQPQADWSADDFFEHVYEEDRERVPEAFPDIVETGDIDFECRIRRTDGDIRWIRVKGRYEKSSAFGEERAFGVIQDITDRKAQERNLRTLERFNRELVENAPIGLIRLDEDFEISYENPRAKEIMGVPADDESVALGRDPRDLQSVNDAGIIDAYDRLAGGEAIDIETWFESLYGSRRYLSVRGVPLFSDGRFDGAILILTDITDSRRRQHTLAERSKELLAIHRTRELLQDGEAPTERLLGDIVSLLPESFQHETVAAARIEYGPHTVTAGNFAETDDRLAVTESTREGDQVRIEVVYLEAQPPADMGPFLEEEWELLETFATLLVCALDRSAGAT